MPDDITIAIDGIEIKTQPGKMVLEAAVDAGIYIPYLCYHPGMKPFAACRMCVVSVEGGRGYPAACTLPVQDGMSIRSETHEVNELRRSVMEMLIAEHPSGCLTCHRVDICGPNDICLRHVSVNDRCVTCPKNERCEFKDTVRYLGMELESALNYNYKQIPLEVSDPFYDRDYNLCITCGRCVRACEEIRGDNAITFTERSGKALVGTSFGSSLLESGCEFCGSCIDVCPVGALVEREHKWEKARTVERTVCPHCPVGCQLNLELNGRGELIRVVPEHNSPANRGQACFKGKFGLEFINSRSRLRQPMIRRNGNLVEATWEEALDFVAGQLSRYKGDSFALLASPDGTNEELYLAQKFARAVMNSNNVDLTSNVQPELTIALEQALGYGAATNPIWDLEQAGCILVFNSNLTEANNVVGVPIKRAVQNGANLVVIDPREVELTRYTRCWLRPAPGTELLVLGGILRELLDQGLVDTEWIERNCESPTTLYYYLNNLDLGEVAAITQVPQERIAEAARLFGGADCAALCYALDNVPEDLQRDCVNALVNLVLLTGNVGKPGAGIYPMRQGANEQGSWDMACIPNRLPGVGPGFLSEADARRNSQTCRELEERWECSLPTAPGRGIAETLAAARDGSVKAMIVIGDSPNLANRRLGEGLDALQNLDFLVVMDSFLSAPAQLAGVVLPRSTFAEKDGTYTNLERRIQRIRPVLAPGKGEAKSEQWFLIELAKRLGAPGFDYPSAEAVMDEIVQVVPNYAGLSYGRLESESALVLRSGLESPKPTQLLYASKEYRGIQWPGSTTSRVGTAVLYLDGFPSGRAELIVPRFRSSQVPLDEEYPAWFVPGRVLFQEDREINVVTETSGSSNGNVSRNRIVRDELVELNPSDADSWSISEGDMVEVQTRRGRLAGLARLDSEIPFGVVSVVTLFGQLAVDLQASEDPDPMSKVPGLDILAARVVKSDEAARAAAG